MGDQIWHQCVQQLMSEGQWADCAVVGLRTGRVLAAAAGGVFQHLSRRELRHLLAVDRRRLQTRGLSMGGVPLTLLREDLQMYHHVNGLTGDNDDGDDHGNGVGQQLWCSMDLRTKQRPSQGVAVCRTRSHLLILMGQHGVGSGLLNHRAHQMAACLRNAGA